MTKIDNILPKLKKLLKEEMAFQEKQKAITKQKNDLKARKEEIGRIFKREMKTDTWANDFVTAIKIQRLNITVKDSEKAKDFFSNKPILDKEAVEKYHEMTGKAIPGIDIKKKTTITFRKKKDGLVSI